MTTYFPDNWVLVEINSKEGKIRKVLGGWRSSYLTGNSWRLSSGVTKIVEKKDFYEIHNESGSLYICPMHTEGFSRIMIDTFNYYKEKLKTIDETATIERIILEEPSCNPHPNAPHGFNRDASHNAGRYVCDCESWEEESNND